MKVEMRSIEKVMPYEQNPRINDQAVDAVARVHPGVRIPAADRGGRGRRHHRAATRAGRRRRSSAWRRCRSTSPPTSRPSRCGPTASPTTRSRELADWDYELLPIELAELRGHGLRPRPAGLRRRTNWTKLLGGGMYGNEGLTDPDAVPEPPDEATTQPGDLWMLGDHRLLCGDSQQRRGRRPAAGRRSHPSRQHRPAVQRQGRAAQQQRHRRRPEQLQRDQYAAAQMHHQAFDVARQGQEPRDAGRSCAPKDRPLANDFVSDEDFDEMLQAWFGNMARVLEAGRVVLHLGRLRQPRQLPAGAEGVRVSTSARASSGTSSIRS